MRSDGNIALATHRTVAAVASHLKKPVLITLARVAGAALAFALQLVLARSLSQDHLGIYFTAISAATVLAIVTAIGYPSAMVRFLLRYSVKGREAWRARFVANAERDTLILSLIGLVILVVASRFAFSDPAVGWALVVSAPLVPAIAQMRISGAQAIAEDRSYLGFLPDTIGRPLLTFVCVLALVAWQRDITLIEATALTTFAGVAMAAMQGILVKRAGGKAPVAASPSPNGTRRLDRAWRRTSMALILPALFAGLLVDVVLVWSSVFVTPDEIAILAIAAKLAFLSGFAGQALMQIDMPKISRLYFAGEMGECRRLVLRSMVIALGVSVAALAFFSVTGAPILSLFGPDYIAGAPVLIVMCLAMIVRVPGLYALQLLTIAGRQTVINRILPFIIAIMLALIAGFASPFGATGIAAALAVALLVHSAIFAALAYRRM